CGSRRSPLRAVRWRPALHSPPGSLETYPEPAAGPSWRASTSETPFSHRTRAAALASLAAEPVDVLVIGGGITGAGIARDAALRGFRTAVVDKGDFGGGTSSVSSRLIHGGIRYLEQGEFRLVFEASRERRVLLGIAPHLVHPLPFLFPVYRGARIPAWKLRAGMWMYDLLAAFHNVKMHRWLGRKATQRLEPGLRDKELKGAALYYDAQTDDARLVIATMRSAAHAGALVANYAEVTALIKPDGRVGGATVRDELTGRTSTVRALVVVNAAGPWVDRVRRLDDAGSEPLLPPRAPLSGGRMRRVGRPAPPAAPAGAGGAAASRARPPLGREPGRLVAPGRRNAHHFPRRAPRGGGPSRGPPARAGWPSPRSP